jgi:hypothetical protein
MYEDELPICSDTLPMYADELPICSDTLPMYADELPICADKLAKYAHDLPMYEDGQRNDVLNALEGAVIGRTTPKKLLIWSKNSLLLRRFTSVRWSAIASSQKNL